MRDYGKTQNKKNNISVRRLHAQDRGLRFDPIVRKWTGAHCSANCTNPEFIDKNIAHDVDPSLSSSKKNNHIWRRSLTLVSWFRCTANPI